MTPALKQLIIEALSKAKRQIQHVNVAPHSCIGDAITALRAEPVPETNFGNIAEPIAYFDFQERGFYWASNTSIDPVPVAIKVDPMPLFTAPQSAPLTDKEIAAAWISISDPVALGSQFIGKNGEAVREFVRAIEQAHNIKEKT